MKIIYIIVGVLLACNTVEKKAPDIPIKIYVNEDGSTTVFTRYDSSATIVNLTKDGELLDSTWLLAKPEISNDSLIKDYFRMVQGSKHQ